MKMACLTWGAAAAVLVGAMAVGCTKKDDSTMTPPATPPAQPMMTPPTTSPSNAMSNASDKMKAMGQEAQMSATNAMDAAKQKMGATTMPSMPSMPSMK